MTAIVIIRGEDRSRITINIRNINMVVIIGSMVIIKIFTCILLLLFLLLLSLPILWSSVRSAVDALCFPFVGKFFSLNSSLRESISPSW